MLPSIKKITVMIVDDHPLLREGMSAVLRREPDMAVVAEASNGREAIENYRQHRPDVTLMDLQMPRVKGVEAIQTIRGEFPNARILVVTTYDGDVQALQALRAGACGFLLKKMLRKELPEAIRAVHEGKRRILGEIAVAIAEHSAEDTLTAREIEVLRSVAEGNANKEVAARLCIAEDTVKAHMGNVLSKLSARDRTHAVLIALKRGIIES